MFLRIFVISMIYVSMTAAQKTNLTLGVYYGSSCSGWKNFMVNQLWPVYNSLGDHFDIDLVPNGSANYTNLDGKLNFTCRHGRTECVLSMIQACGKRLLPPNKMMKLAHCIANDPKPDENNYIMRRKVEEPGFDTLSLIMTVYSCQCGPKNDIRFRELDQCMEDGRGEQEFKKNADLTKSLDPKATTFPWLTLNGAHDSAFQTEALIDLKSALCKKFQGTKPDGC